jgi:antitoxin CcdA
MSTAAKRKTSLSLDAARDLHLNVSAIADAALKGAVAEARRRRWLEENADAFKAQEEWHEKHGHPLADIMVGPGADSWKN